MIDSIPSQDTQEKLCGAYIRAVVAQAGCTLDDRNRGEYGCDYVVRPVIHRNGHIRDANWSINIQAKSTINADIRQNYIAHNLDVINYNDLVDPDMFTPLILVVYVMPREHSQWLCQREDCMEMRNCAYWVSLRGQPSSSNARTVAVHIPRVQVFTPSAVREMLEKVRGGQQL